MYAVRNVNADVAYLGVEDRRTALFENIFPLDRGVTYNSFLIRDEKTALLDTVDSSCGLQFLENLRVALEGKALDYILIHHMEPDHCGLLADVILQHPGVQVVASAKTFTMIQQFFGSVLKPEQKLVVKEGDTLSLGKHQLKFIMAPMVHWPEVMFTLDTTDRMLYSADAFGVFGTNNGNIFTSELDCRAKDFVDDARRYYANIVGKYGTQVQSALKKLAAEDIRMICPLHGPIWCGEDISFICSLYEKWSTYAPEEKSVAVFFNSIYGHTESVINAFTMLLAERGVRSIAAYDVSKTELSVLIAETFRVSNIVFGATTYNNGLFPKLENLITDMEALNVQNKKVSIIENGSWAPQSGKLVRAAMDAMKNMEQVGEVVTVKSACFDREALEALADAVAESMK